MIKLLATDGSKTARTNYEQVLTILQSLKDAEAVPDVLAAALSSDSQELAAGCSSRSS